jgi:hypothetical protein
LKFLPFHREKNRRQTCHSTAGIKGPSGSADIPGGRVNVLDLNAIRQFRGTEGETLTVADGGGGNATLAAKDAVGGVFVFEIEGSIATIGIPGEGGMSLTHHGITDDNIASFGRSPNDIAIAQQGINFGFGATRILNPKFWHSGIGFEGQSGKMNLGQNRLGHLGNRTQKSFGLLGGLRWTHYALLVRLIDNQGQY